MRLSSTAEPPRFWRTSSSILNIDQQVLVDDCWRQFYQRMVGFAARSRRMIRARCRCMSALECDPVGRTSSCELKPPNSGRYQ